MNPLDRKILLFIQLIYTNQEREGKRQRIEDFSRSFYSGHFSFVPSLERSILVFVSLLCCMLYVVCCIASLIKLDLISSIHFVVFESVI